LSDILLSNFTIFNYNKIENLIVFGDSHSAVNTNFTDMSYTGKNCSRGKNWPLYLIKLNNMTLWNFSVGGSVVDEKLVRKSKFYKIDFKKQYSYFYEKMSKGKIFYNKWNSNNSLFVIWIGNNDIKYLYRNNMKMEIDVITYELFNIIEKIYDLGARNILILKLLPIYRAPTYRGKKKKEVQIFNINIKSKSEKFFNKHLNSNLIIYNTVEIFEDIINNCNKYKFKDCIHAWTNNEEKKIKEYFWINSHISDLGNKILSNNINDLLSSINT